jgi:hypothetical protein
MGRVLLSELVGIIDPPVRECEVVGWLVADVRTVAIVT